jgi:CspA family cold shock protein
MPDSFTKKENIKKNVTRKKQKDLKKQERKLNNNKGKGLDSMIAYVDEYGNLSSTPPERMLIQKKPAQS